VYRGGLALKSILLNKRHIHTYYQFSQPTLDEKLKNNPKIGILLVYFEGEKKKKKKKKKAIQPKNSKGLFPPPKQEISTNQADLKKKKKVMMLRGPRLP
jgi:hypothetical protein